jgi:hypothetical protein
VKAEKKPTETPAEFWNRVSKDPQALVEFMLPHLQERMEREISPLRETFETMKQREALDNLRGREMDVNGTKIQPFGDLDKMVPKMKEIYESDMDKWDVVGESMGAEGLYEILYGLAQNRTMPQMTEEVRRKTEEKTKKEIEERERGRRIMELGDNRPPPRKSQDRDAASDYFALEGRSPVRGPFSG